MINNIKCYCVICNKLIGTYYPSQTRKTCSLTCKKKLHSKNNTGKGNPNYKNGKTIENRCQKCNCLIDSRSIHCYKCRNIVTPGFKGKKHTKQTKKLIGKKSKAKFTKEYKEKIREKHRGKKKRAINGYILIKDYQHPNRNAQNDVLEHIKIMSSYIGRPIKKGEVIHHINMVRNDNRIENLYLSTRGKHMKIHGTLNTLVKDLLKNNIIHFKNGKYLLNPLRRWC